MWTESPDQLSLLMLDRSAAGGVARVGGGGLTRPRLEVFHGWSSITRGGGAVVGHMKGGGLCARMLALATVDLSWGWTPRDASFSVAPASVEGELLFCCGC